jgi:hypothetical protein
MVKATTGPIDSGFSEHRIGNYLFRILEHHQAKRGLAAPADSNLRTSTLILGRTGLSFPSAVNSMPYLSSLRENSDTSIFGKWGMVVFQTHFQFFHPPFSANLPE